LRPRGIDRGRIFSRRSERRTPSNRIFAAGSDVCVKRESSSGVEHRSTCLRGIRNAAAQKSASASCLPTPGTPAPIRTSMPPRALDLTWMIQNEVPNFMGQSETTVGNSLREPAHGRFGQVDGISATIRKSLVKSHASRRQYLIGCARCHREIRKPRQGSD
jgi:hypothetical protein